MDLSQRRPVAGRYRLLSPLGTGGMGTVWRARDEVLGREVAVKEVVFPHGLSDEDREVLRERTRREARAAARLDHPSAVTVFDVVEEDGAPYLVMELVEARTLSQVVRSDGPLSPQRTAEVGLALLGALETAHRQGIVHRDVKPGNVLLCPASAGGRVVLTDFGIASTAGDPSITSTGLLLGSPSYIAPERARGQAPGPASDLWSLGATLFTAVEGRPPYDGGDPLVTVTQVVTGEHAPFVAAGPLVPLLEGLLERDPDKRLTAQQARAQLTRLAVDAPTTAAPLPEPEAEERTDRTAALPMREVSQAAAGDQGTTARVPLAAAAPAPRTPAALARPPLVVEEPRRREPRRSTAPLALLAAVLLAAAAVGGFLLSGRDVGDGGSQAGASPGASATPTPPAQAVLPEGWTRYEDPTEGWSVGVPPGYVRSLRDSQVQFRNEATRRSLRIEADRPRGEPLEVWTAFSKALSGSLAQYRQIRLEPTQFLGQDAADLEFTFFDQTTLHVLDRTFVDADGEQAYALYWQVRDSDWEDALPLFEQIAKTFRPRP